MQQVPSDVAKEKEKLIQALKGVDVLVSVVGSASVEEKNTYAEAALEAGVAVYFPSEFGL